MQHSCSSERTGPCGGAHWSRGQAAGAARARSSGTGVAARGVRWRPRKASCWMRGDARSWGQQGQREEGVKGQNHISKEGEDVRYRLCVKQCRRAR